LMNERAGRTSRSNTQKGKRGEVMPAKRHPVEETTGEKGRSKLEKKRAIAGPPEEEHPVGNRREMRRE